jgi:hypothetical protein
MVHAGEYIRGPAVSRTWRLVTGTEPGEVQDPFICRWRNYRL